MRTILPTIGLTFGVFASILGIMMIPGEKTPVVAVFGPDADDQTIMAALIRADARIIEQAGLPGSVIVISEKPGLASRLKAAGAWVVFNPLGATGCSPNTTLRKISGLQSA